MADNMDKLLYGIGAEEDARVDYAAIYDAILAKAGEEGQAGAGRKPAYRWRALGAAAAFIAMIGVGAAAISSMGMGSDATESMAAPQMEYAAAQGAAEESAAAAPAAEAPAAAAPAEARGADVPAAYDGKMTADATSEAYAGEAAEQEAAAEIPAEEAPVPMPTAAAEEGQAENGEAQSGSASGSEEDVGGSLGSHGELDPDYMVTLGQPRAGFEELLAQAGLEVSEGAWNAALTPGRAYVAEYGEGGHYALWNTGNGFYHIAGEGVGREELIGMLQEVC